MLTADTDARFAQIPNGIPGLETRLPLLFSHCVADSQVDICSLVALTSTNVAKICSPYTKKSSIAIGGDAELVIWDHDLDRTVPRKRTDIEVARRRQQLQQTQTRQGSRIPGP